MIVAILVRPAMLRAMTTQTRKAMTRMVIVPAAIPAERVIAIVVTMTAGAGATGAAGVADEDTIAAGATGEDMVAEVPTAGAAGAVVTAASRLG